MAKKFSLESMLTLTDGITAPFKAIEKAGTSFSKSMKKNFGGVGKDIKAIDSAINKAAIGVAAFGVAGVTASAMLIKSTASQADEWSKQARQIGITTEELQKLIYVADMQGVSSESLIKSYEKMNKNIGELRTGSGTLITYLKKVDGGFLKTLQSAGSSEEAFKLLIGAIHNTPDEFGKAALATAAFGKSGMDIMRIAEAGSDGIASLMSEIESYGLITTDAGNNSEKFNDDIARMHYMIIGLKNRAFNALIPVLSKIVERIRVMFYMADRGNGVLARFIVWINKIDVDKVVDGIRNFGIWIFNTGKGVINFIKWLQPLIPTILYLVAAIKIITTSMTIFNAVMTMVKLTSAATTWQFLAIIVAVTALIAAGVWLYKNWDLVLSVFGKAWESIKNGFAWIADNGIVILASFGMAFNKALLTPINLVVEGIQLLLSLIAKIPGMGKIAGDISKGIESIQGMVNTRATGSSGVFDYAGSARSAFATYGSPTTRGAESRSYSESRTTNEVIVSADRGASVREPGRAPTRSLSYGRAQ